MNTQLPLNNAGLILVAVNGIAVATAPASSVSLLDVISVLPNKVNDITSTLVDTIRITCVGTKNYPDTYDFAQDGEAAATATAGITVGSVTAGDKWTITVDGVAFTYTMAGGNTASTLKTAMDALLAANTQGFTFTSSNNTGVLLYNITAPGTSSWNGRVVTSTTPVNAGPTFSSPVDTDFTGGSGIAEQFQAFMDSLTLTSYLPIYTGLLVNGNTTVKNQPSFMLNSKWVVSSAYDGVNTKISYQSPLLLGTAYTVLGDQTAAASTFNV